MMGRPQRGQCCFRLCLKGSAASCLRLCAQSGAERTQRGRAQCHRVLSDPLSGHLCRCLRRVRMLRSRRGDLRRRKAGDDFDPGRQGRDLCLLQNSRWNNQDPGHTAQLSVRRHAAAYLLPSLGTASVFFLVCRKAAAAADGICGDGGAGVGQAGTKGLAGEPFWPSDGTPGRSQLQRCRAPLQRAQSPRSILCRRGNDLSRKCRRNRFRPQVTILLPAYTAWQNRYRRPSTTKASESTGIASVALVAASSTSSTWSCSAAKGPRPSAMGGSSPGKRIPNPVASGKHTSSALARDLLYDHANN